VKKKYFLAIVIVLIAVSLIEVGILSLLVAMAYHAMKGSIVTLITGSLMVILGVIGVVGAKRLFTKKEDSKSKGIY
jgi:uncharacterized membrane protein HdeD (DUF308 family)